MSAALFMLVDAKGYTQKVRAISNLQSIIKNKGQGSTHGIYYKCNQLQKTSFLKHKKLEKIHALSITEFVTQVLRMLPCLTIMIYSAISL